MYGGGRVLAYFFSLPHKYKKKTKKLPTHITHAYTPPPSPSPHANQNILSYTTNLRRVGLFNEGEIAHGECQNGNGGQAFTEPTMHLLAIAHVVVAHV
jgi:hypothetical protein